jgi:hypothetical protein
MYTKKTVYLFVRHHPAIQFCRRSFSVMMASPLIKQTNLTEDILDLDISNYRK